MLAGAWPEGHGLLWCCCLQITVLSRADEDDFLLLASDGLWDVMANQVSRPSAFHVLCSGVPS